MPCAIEPVAKLLESVGKNVRVPVLLHYAENDLYFNAPTSRLWYERFAAAGARAEYVLQPAFGRDGHYIFSETLGVRYWLPAVEQFLARHGVPFERLDAGQPIVSVEHVPHVRSDACRNLYRAFLESPAPRAYAVSGDGRCGFASGLPDAADIAVRECRTNAKEAVRALRGGRRSRVGAGRQGHRLRRAVKRIGFPVLSLLFQSTRPEQLRG